MSERKAGIREEVGEGGDRRGLGEVREWERQEQNRQNKEKECREFK